MEDYDADSSRVFGCVDVCVFQCVSRVRSDVEPRMAGISAKLLTNTRKVNPSSFAVRSQLGSAPTAIWNKQESGPGFARKNTPPM